jgi:DNA polymerase-3 subunit alpha
MGAIAMTEHGNIDSHVKFEKAAEGTGIKPIFGCEVYMPVVRRREVASRSRGGRRAETQMKHHLTLIAQTRGLREPAQARHQVLAELLPRAGRHLERPLKEHKEPGSVVLSGCQGSLLFCSTVGGKDIPENEASYRRGLRVARAFAREFGDNYFIEVQAFPELGATTRRFNPLGAARAGVGAARRDDGLPLHAPRRGRGSEDPPQPPARQQADPRGAGARLGLRRRRSALRRTTTASGVGSAPPGSQPRRPSGGDRLHGGDRRGMYVALPKLPMVRFPVPPGFEDAKAYWRHLLKEGWRERGYHRRPSAYRRRRRSSLRTRWSSSSPRTSLTTSCWSRRASVHMKDRGSSLSVLARAPLRVDRRLLPRHHRGRSAWSSRTAPLRPLHQRRSPGPPDIDLDFPAPERPPASFYERMFGPGCVNNIGTFTQFKGKNSLDDVAKVFQRALPSRSPPSRTS